MNEYTGLFHSEMKIWLFNGDWDDVILYDLFHMERENDLPGGFCSPE